MFKSDPSIVPAQELLNCKTAYQLALLIRNHFHYSIGDGAGKYLATFTVLERKLAELIISEGDLLDQKLKKYNYDDFPFSSLSSSDIFCLARDARLAGDFDFVDACKQALMTNNFHHDNDCEDEE